MRAWIVARNGLEYAAFMKRKRDLVLAEGLDVGFWVGVEESRPWAEG